MLAIAGCARASSEHAPLRWGGDAEGGAPFVEADPADPARSAASTSRSLQMIGRALHREPVFVQVAWASIEASVERGDFSIGMSGVEDRPELRERHAVSIPYFEFHEVLAVRFADSARYRTLQISPASASRRSAARAPTRCCSTCSGHGGPIVVSYDDDVHPYSDLVSGRVDAVLLDNIIADRSLRRSGRLRHPAGIRSRPVITWPCSRAPIPRCAIR